MTWFGYFLLVAYVGVALQVAGSDKISAKNRMLLLCGQLSAIVGILFVGTGHV